MSEWIPVTERLPEPEKDGAPQEVLINVLEIESYGENNEYHEKWHWEAVGFYEDCEWYSTWIHGHKKISDTNNEDTKCYHIVTAWMPLPEPYKEDEE